MSVPLPTTSGDCCSSCDSPVVSQVPGPTGATGANGTNGTNGVNPFTTLLDDFQMPNADATGSAKVGSTAWMVIGQILTIQGAGVGSSNATQAGFLIVTAIGDSQHVTLLNSAQYSDLNKAGGQFVTNGSSVGPAGGRGVAGSNGSATLNSLSPTTTKGDLILDNGVNNPNASDVRLAVGSDGQLLHARSSQGTGVQWSGIDLTGTNSALSGALPISKGGSGQITQQAALDALMPATPAAGDLVRYVSSHWSRLAKGAALQVLRVNSGATDLEWATPAGGVNQMVGATSNTLYTGVISSTIPLDDTIPQNTEGTQILSLSITPQSNTSKLVITALVPFSSGSNTTAILSLFNAVGNAIAAQPITATSGQYNQIELHHGYTPGSTSPITVSLNLGSSSGALLTIGGLAGTRLLGGVQYAWLRVVEYAA